MDDKRENRIVWAFFVAFVTIIVVSLLCGCKTKTILQTDVVTIHDTLITHHSDTVREARVSHHTDTVKQIETHTFTLNNAGDTIREIHHYHDLWHTTVIDSTYRYKARMDSLERALEVEKDKNKLVKTKKVVSWWEYVVLFAIVGSCIFFVLKRRGKTFNEKI